MNATVESSDLFQQSVRTFQSLLRIGAEVQEQSARCYADLLHGVASDERWQQQQLAAIQLLIETNKRKTEETIHLINENARESLDLLRKALNGSPLGAYADRATAMLDNWELDLTTMCRHL